MSEFELTQYGFKWAKCEIERCYSDRKYAGIRIKTPKTGYDLNIDFTPSGNVRIFYKDEQILKVTKAE